MELLTENFMYIEGMPEDKNNVPFYTKYGFSVMERLWRMDRQSRFAISALVSKDGAWDYIKPIEDSSISRLYK